LSDKDTLTPGRRRGLLLVLSSPSGAGKTTLSRRLLAADDDITMSVSVTTRPPREGEVDGKDYHFISVAEFERMRAGGELLESAKVFDNYYGTPRAQVEAALAAGRDVMFDIDWQGTQQLGAEMDDDLVRIFVLPPSAAALEERLKSRAKDPPEVVARRMAKASGEISHWAEYDYVLVNDDIDRCERAISQILRVERLRRKRQIGLVDFVRSLQAEL
jgi:guanylate kinase